MVELPEDLQGRATLNVAEAGRVLGIGSKGAYRGIHDGTIPALKVGRRFLVPVHALMETLGSAPSPQQMRLSDEEVERIASRVVALLGQRLGA